ncbi:MAG: threonylcarbamoyl-AMP synthase [Prevotellaceae bacterium]|jgi:L-threonylcarbamoyladenylate synthase|nr:threonylcarbamoyl-AMP synthase [Prevotellaceae bacterium]
MLDDIKQCVETLRQGGVILYPTDTIWGLGCDATNSAAVQRIYDIKRRCNAKSMLVLVDSMARIEQYVSEVPDIAWDLVELADKPLTVVYPQARNLAANLVANDGSIGIRVTREAFSRQLCERFRKPVVSTSANMSGEPAPVLFADISQKIIGQVDFVVKFRQEDTMPAQPSSIVRLGLGGEIEIIRA